jgi:hypothetical protein
MHADVNVHVAKTLDVSGVTSTRIAVVKRSYRASSRLLFLGSLAYKR